MMTFVIVCVPALVYCAFAWALRPAAILAAFAAPIGWGALAFAGALAYFGPGGQLPQVPLILAAMFGAVVAFCAFVVALGLMTRDRRHATAIAFANGLAWITAVAILSTGG